MGSIAFRFNKPVSFNYAAGPAQAGKDGDTGYQGTAGTAIYFTDYELDNSYSIELALQRIENNYVLSGNSNIIIEGRKYKAGDLIISNKANCYKIIESVDKNSDFSFDIEFLGKFQTTDTTGSNNVASVYIYDVTETRIYDYNNTSQLLVEYPYNMKCATANNRRYFNGNNIGIQTSTAVQSTSDVFNLYGRWYKCVVILNDDSPNCKYTVRLDFPNSKTYNMNSYNGIYDNMPIDQNLYNSSTKFNKSIEFVDCGVNFKPLSDPDRKTYIFKEIAYKTGEEPMNAIPTCFISDMSMDKIYLSKNNLKCTFNDSSFISDFANGTISYSAVKNVVPHNTLGYGVLSATSPDGSANLRAGESAWFSTDSSTRVIDDIYNFFANNTNLVVSVICSNNVTGDMQIRTDIDVHFDDTYCFNNFKADIDHTTGKILNFGELS